MPKKTRKQAEARASQRTRAQAMREWMQDRISAAQKRRRAEALTLLSNGHGVTSLMRSIGRPAPEVIVQHKFASRRDRRHRRQKALQGVNTPYQKPIEEITFGRSSSWRLRKELRDE